MGAEYMGIQPVVSNHLNHLKKLIMERVVIFACLLALGSCMKIHFKNCGSTASIEEVKIDPCDKEPCTLPRGGSSTISIKFAPQKDYPELHSKVCGQLGPICAPFPIDHPNHCTAEPATGITCPVKKGTEVDFHYTIPVVVKWQMFSGKEQVVCIMMQTHLR